MRVLPSSRIAKTLFVLAALGLGACQDRREGAIAVGVIGDRPTLSDSVDGPLDPPQALLRANVAQGLVQFDANGQIVPGLAERWNVTDDGLSYIFRLRGGEWPDGTAISAHQVARILRRQIGRSSRNPLRDAMGAVEEIVAMTDRVLEIRLSAPRPNLLQILAQPELAVVRDGQGAGPFRIAGDAADGIRLVRSVAEDEDGGDEEEAEREDQVLLYARSPSDAVRLFAAGRLDLVLGGTFDDLPVTGVAELPRGAIQFDPAAGLFGLVPARTGGPLDDPDLRRLLIRAVDREALIAAFGVPGLLPRATLLEQGLDGVTTAEPPEWLGVPIADRRAAMAAQARRLVGDDAPLTLRIALPDGPGSELLLNRLASDWSVLGIGVERAAPGTPADLRLVDAVAPSISPAWYLRQFRCTEVPICDERADELIAAARAAPVAPQRTALLAEAARLADEAALFIPLTAPIRWSLVADRVQGFAVNRFARHSLTALDERVERRRPE